MTDRILLLGRHAQANDSHRLGDKFRTLSDAGKAQAMGNGLILEKLNCVPDIIIHSDAIRAQETVAHASSIWGQPAEKIPDPRIYLVPDGLTDNNFINFFGRILDQADDNKKCLMVVGHEPYIGRYATLMSGGLPASMKGEYPTATITVLHSSAESWSLVEPDNCKLSSVILNGQQVVKPDLRKPSTQHAPEIK